MDADSLVYGLHWVFVISALLFSWSRTERQFLHPHFLFTVMLCVHISDFLVRGYTEERSLIFLEREDVYRYQLMMLTILTIVVLGSSLFRTSSRERLVDQAIEGMQEVAGTRPAVFVLVIFLLVSELTKRFVTVDWSLDEVIRQTFAPRGTRDWEQAAYSGNFVFSLTQIFMPLGGAAAAYLTVGARKYGMVIAFALLGLILFILVTDGSRTPVAITFAAFGLFWTMKYKTFRARVVIVGIVVSAMVAIFSLMFMYRAIGYQQDNAGLADESHFEVKYHQDDSYYRAIYAYAYSDQTGKAWSAIDFATAIVVNPIPRAIWPSKPALDAAFWDGFKLDYVTNLFLGEMVAITGPTMSVIFSPLIGLFIYWLLYKSHTLLRYPLGLVAYLLVALYSYQCLRSLLNLTHFMYLPGLAVVMTLMLRRIQYARAENERYFHRVNQRRGGVI